MAAISLLIYDAPKVIEYAQPIFDLHYWLGISYITIKYSAILGTNCISWKIQR